MNSKQKKISTERSVGRREFVRSIGVLAAGYGLCCGSAVNAQKKPPFSTSALNHMTLAVSDPSASVHWYQGLFGMPIAARQGNTAILQVGDGPQFIAISGNATDNPRITQFCLGVDNFDHQRAVQILEEHGVEETRASGPMQSMNRMRVLDSGGSSNGTAELFFGDPDGIRVQLQDPSYCGGTGVLGNECLSTPEPAPTAGLLALGEFNHFTLFVSDQRHSIQFYQSLFGTPIDTYQGALPILRVGRGKQFLALSQQPSPSKIHHASLSVDDFDVDRIFSVLDQYGLTILGEASGATGPLQAYVTMRGQNRGGAFGGTPELYLTDPDGILLQLQDSLYCGGNGYLGDQCGTVERPTGRNV
ncbi:MAG: VOC family protein [Alphaproteobacteria bacterium]